MHSRVTLVHVLKRNVTLTAIFSHNLHKVVEDKLAKTLLQ